MNYRGKMQINEMFFGAAGLPITVISAGTTNRTHILVDNAIPSRATPQTQPTSATTVTVTPAVVAPVTEYVSNPNTTQITEPISTTIDVTKPADLSSIPGYTGGIAGGINLPNETPVSTNNSEIKDSVDLAKAKRKKQIIIGIVVLAIVIGAYYMMKAKK